MNDELRKQIEEAASGMTDDEALDASLDVIQDLGEMGLIYQCQVCQYLLFGIKRVPPCGHWDCTLVLSKEISVLGEQMYYHMATRHPTEFADHIRRNTEDPQGDLSAVAGNVQAIRESLPIVVDVMDDINEGIGGVARYCIEEGKLVDGAVAVRGLDGEEFLELFHPFMTDYALQTALASGN